MRTAALGLLLLPHINRVLKQKPVCNPAADTIGSPGTVTHTAFRSLLEFV